jgi:hypothetical protein
MLKVNLHEQDPQVTRSIREHCSRIGEVRSVRVHRSPCAFALIEMWQREQTYELTHQFGGSTFGTCALIHLEQEGLRAA